MPDKRKLTPYWKRLETWFLAAAFGILAVTAITDSKNWNEFTATRAMTRASRTAAEESDALLAYVTEAEASQRGFLLTGREYYLNAYRKAVARIPVQLKTLRGGAPEESAALDELRKLIADRLDELKKGIDARRTSGFSGAQQAMQGDEGWQYMERIRALCERISAAQIQSYTGGALRISGLTRRLVTSSFVGDLALSVLLLFAAIAMHSGARRRERLIGALQHDEQRLRDLREKAEAAESRARNILESIGDGFVSFDRDWTITYCNAEAGRIFGCAPAEIIGKNFWAQFPDLAGHEIETVYRRAEQDRKAASFQSFVGTRNVYWEQSVYPSPDGLTVYFRDVTQRHRMEERARNSHKLESLGVLAGGIAHDFNNLLTAILGSASLMMEDLPPGSDAYRLTGNILQASERAGQLTRQMLAYSGRGQFVVENLDLAAQVREITALVEAAITAEVQLVLDLQSDGALIEADGGQMQQLVMNLVINGAEAMSPKGGTLVVSTRVVELDAHQVADSLAGDSPEPGRFLLLEVHDNGVGMDKETIGRIFDPFFTTKFTGRGLGLAAVLGIVRGHKGGIKVYSNPGQGTTFRVFFPVVGGVMPAKVEKPVLDYRGSALVMVVDDEVGVQQLATSTLEHYGYKVVLASNGQEAIEVFQAMNDRIALVVLDMTMPVMNGQDTLKTLRKLRPDVRVIASSGYNETEALRRFGNGVSGFLQKPYRAMSLAEKVKVTLG